MTKRPLPFICPGKPRCPLAQVMNRKGHHCARSECQVLRTKALGLRPVAPLEPKS